jgi:release factor glutamine methyltransferase
VARAAGVGRRTSASGLSSDQSVRAVVDEIAALLASRPEIDEPVREARELVAALLDVPKHWPLLHGEKWVDATVRIRARAAAEQRAAGAPLAYAVRKANFRKLNLHVDERVLIPRPETEMLVELVLDRCGTGAGGTAIDVGTGSGAIAIALATEGRFERVIATDISSDALDVARGNAARYGGDIDFLEGDLMSTSDDRRQTSEGKPDVRVVVSNPPYIAYDEIRALPASVRDWEPMIALLSGRDGLAVTARLVRQAATRLRPGGLLALEVDARRASLVAELVSTDARYDGVSVQLDLAGRERFVLATRRGDREHE